MASGSRKSADSPKMRAAMVDKADLSGPATKDAGLQKRHDTQAGAREYANDRMKEQAEEKRAKLARDKAAAAAKKTAAAKRAATAKKAAAKKAKGKR